MPKGGGDAYRAKFFRQDVSLIELGIFGIVVLAAIVTPAERPLENLDGIGLAVVGIIQYAHVLQSAPE